MSKHKPKNNIANPASKINANKPTINPDVNWEKIKLAVAIPSGSHVCANFAMHLSMMFYMLGNSRISTSLINNHSSMGPMKSRYESVNEAKKVEATHILFIDSDQTFPAHTAHTLLNHNKSIVGCVIPQRIAPFGLNARIDNKRISISNSEKGLLKVHTLGTGIMLIRMDVFMKLDEPYFMPKHEGGDEWQGEDESFCYQARLLGNEVYADIDLSRQVGHIGEQVTTLAHAYEFNQQMNLQQRAEQQRAANA